MGRGSQAKLFIVSRQKGCNLWELAYNDTCNEKCIADRASLILKSSIAAGCGRPSTKHYEALGLNLVLAIHVIPDQESLSFNDKTALLRRPAMSLLDPLSRSPRSRYEEEAAHTS